MKRKPVVLAMKVGNMGEPTTLCSVRPLPGNWVCFWLTSKPRWAASSPTRMSGHDQHVDDEEAGDDHAGAREVAAEEEEAEVGADEGDRLG